MVSFMWPRSRITIAATGQALAGPRGELQKFLIRSIVQYTQKCYSLLF